MRKARKKSITGIYHVILQGNNKEPLFLDSEDFAKFIEIIRSKKYFLDENGEQKQAFAIYGYCLMPNHLHMLIMEKDFDIGKNIKRIAISYSDYFRRKYQCCGHIFQDRFKSEPCEDDDYFKTLLCYIHQDPIKSGLCGHVNNYKWSSWSEISGKSEDPICDIHVVLRMMTLGEWRHEILNEIPEESPCLEFDKFNRPFDSEVAKYICEISGCRNIEDFKKRPLKKKITVILKCRTLPNVTLRSIARVSKVGNSTLRRIITQTSSSRI